MKSILRIAPDRARAVPGKSIAGPISLEARRRSVQNATRNAELAETIVLPTESVPGFIELLSQLQGELQPESCIESTFVDAIAASGQSRALMLLKRFQCRLRHEYQRSFEGFKTHRARRIREAAGSPRKDVFPKRTQFRTTAQPVPR